VLLAASHALQRANFRIAGMSSVHKAGGDIKPVLA
jgi:hypothetical protein